MKRCLKILKNLLGITLVTWLAITLTACSQDKKPQMTLDKNPDRSFSALISDSNAKVSWGKDAVSAEILKRTGVNLKLEIITGDLGTRISTMIASDVYPDFILSLDNDNLGKLVQEKALFQMDEYILEHGDNIKRIFGEDLNRMRSEIDGKIYGLNTDYKGFSAQSSSLFHVQYDLLIEAGFPKLKTLDDLFVLMKQYKEKHPSFNGEETIGLTAWGDAWGMNITFNNPAVNAAGYQNDGNYIVSNNLEVTYGLTLQSTKEYFQWLNKLYRHGLFDAESIFQKREKFVEKISKGNVLVATTEYWDMGDSEAALRKNGMENKCYAQIPLLLSEDTQSHISNTDPFGTWKSVITKSCKNPIEAFKFFDTMWSEEMQILCYWGIEGVHYDVKNGLRVQRPDIVEMSIKDPDWKSHTGLSIYNMWSYGQNVKGADGQYINPFGTPEYLYQKQDEVTKQVLNAYNCQTWRDLCPPAQISKHRFVWKLALPKNTEGAYAEDIVNQEIRRIYLPKLILAKNDIDYEEQWNNFVKAVYDAGMKLREDEIQQVLMKQSEGFR